MIRILFLTRAHGEHDGGMERLSYELIKEVRRQPETSVTVLSHQGSRLMSPLFVLTIIPRAVIAARNSDAIHLGDPLLSLTGWLLKKLTRKPVAVTVHGLDIVYPNPLYQLYLRLFFRHFDLYLPISRYVKSLVQSVIKGQRSVVFVPGVQDRFYDPSVTRKDLKKILQQIAAYNLQPGDNVLFTAGRLVKRKGHAWFIQSVLPHLPRDTIYVIAGDGPCRPAIESAATPRVFLLGRVTDRQLKILYNTVAAFVQPNIPVPGDVEGFGLVLLEAALCNRPVFAANLEGISDAVQNGSSGTLLPPGDASAWILALVNFLKRPSPSTTARNYTRSQLANRTPAVRLLEELKSLVNAAS